MNENLLWDIVAGIRYASQSNHEGMERYCKKIMKYAAPPKLKVIYLDNYVGDKLHYKKEGDAGFDVRAAVSEKIMLVPGERKTIPLGFRTQIPEGYEVQMRPRSGLAGKLGISMVNAPGTIDEGWRGEWAVILINLGQEAVYFEPGDRIAQAVLAKCSTAQFVEVDEIEESERGDGGFGHTGVK
jgi:dUTP pyrophosphatase